MSNNSFLEALSILGIPLQDLIADPQYPQSEQMLAQAFSLAFEIEFQVDEYPSDH